MTESLFIFSDLHGSAEAAAAVAAKIDLLSPARVAFLGDCLWPKRSAAAAELLNRLNDRITAVAGNCDDAGNELQLRIPLFGDYAIMNFAGRRLFLTHGDRWNPGHPPPVGAGDILLFGHTHVPLIQRVSDDLLAVNPGSCALPRGGSPASYAFSDGRSIEIRALGSDEILFSSRLNTPNIT